MSSIQNKKHERQTIMASNNSTTTFRVDLQVGPLNTKSSTKSVTRSESSKPPHLLGPSYSPPPPSEQSSQAPQGLECCHIVKIRLTEGFYELVNSPLFQRIAPFLTKMTIDGYIDHTKCYADLYDKLLKIPPGDIVSLNVKLLSYVEMLLIGYENVGNSWIGDKLASIRLIQSLAQMAHRFCHFSIQKQPASAYEMPITILRLYSKIDATLKVANVIALGKQERIILQAQYRLNILALPQTDASDYT
jgi:hypothetical protein